MKPEDVMQHRVGCACGWYYETADKHLGHLQCKHAYELHVQQMHPLRTVETTPH